MWNWQPVLSAVGHLAGVGVLQMLAAVPPRACAQPVGPAPLAACKRTAAWYVQEALASKVVQSTAGRHNELGPNLLCLGHVVKHMNGILIWDRSEVKLDWSDVDVDPISFFAATTNANYMLQHWGSYVNYF